MPGRDEKKKNGPLFLMQDLIKTKWRCFSNFGNPLITDPNM